MADEDNKDVKPGDTLTLGVKDPQGDVTHFKIKKSTKFEKVLNAYASRKGVAASAVRLFLDGKRVPTTSTPGDMDCEEGDVLDAVMEQTGGNY